MISSSRDILKDGGAELCHCSPWKVKPGEKGNPSRACDRRTTPTVVCRSISWYGYPRCLIDAIRCMKQVIHISCAMEIHRSNRLVRLAKIWAIGVYRWLLVSRFLFHQLQRRTKWCLSIARNGASPLLPTIRASDGRRIQKRIMVWIVAWIVLSVSFQFCRTLKRYCSHIDVDVVVTPPLH